MKDNITTAASSPWGKPSLLDQLQHVMRDFKAIQRHKEVSILCHPSSLSFLAEKCEPGDATLGIPVTTSVHLPKTQKTGRTLFPKDPFVEYEESDKRWAVGLGLATEEEVPVFYKLERPTINLSPDFLACESLLKDRITDGLRIPRTFAWE